MEVIATQPQFIPDEGASERRVAAFREFTQVLDDHRDAALGVFDSRHTHLEVIEAARHVATNDETPAALATRALANVFHHGSDIEGGYDPATESALRDQRKSTPQERVRLYRVRTYAARRVAWLALQSSEQTQAA